MALATVVSTYGANDFFGIPILGAPKDDLNAIIQNLIGSEYEKAGLHLKHLAKTTPRLGRTIKISDFTIPCADCGAEKDPACTECKGRFNVIDAHSLRYLQYKLDSAIDNNEPVERAWPESIKAFNLRKKQVPSRAIFQGNIFKIDQNAFLIKDLDGGVFYLMGCVTAGASVGQPYVGYYWPMPQRPHTYKDANGKAKTVKSYTLNLWWDY